MWLNLASLRNSSPPQRAIPEIGSVYLNVIQNNNMTEMFDEGLSKAYMNVTINQTRECRVCVLQEIKITLRMTCC